MLCCKCGTEIEPNPSYMCLNCLTTEADITEGIPTQAVIQFCPKCERYLKPPGRWVPASLESGELLGLCLGRLRGLNQVQLKDANFVWTEPHSRRIKVNLVLQKEVIHGAVVEQNLVVEYTVHPLQCSDCNRVAAKDFWQANVQVRQKTAHKKTLYYLEQLILKHEAQRACVNIKQEPGGIDFFFNKKTDAVAFIEFLLKKVPCRYQTSQQLKSHDVHNNTFNYKFTYSVELAPICKDDIVCLPKAFAQRLGNMGQLCIVYRITDRIHLIDPKTCQICDVDGKIYFQHPFQSIAGLRQLTQFVVLEADLVGLEGQRLGAGHAPQSARHQIADAYVMRASEMIDQIHVRTHLGHLIKSGDTVLGFDVKNSNVNNAEMEKIPVEKLPDLILVKKVPIEGSASGGRRKRSWHLRRLAEEEVASQGGGSTSTGGALEYEDFLNDVEDDPELRDVRVFVDRAEAAEAAGSIGAAAAAPILCLDEMMNDMDLRLDATGEAGSSMIE